MSQEKRTRSPEASREAILDAAEDLFAAKGYNGTSMRDIARKAGKSQGLIHHHFGYKKDLWEAVKKRFGAKFLEALGPYFKSERIDQEFLTKWPAHYLKFWQDNPKLRRIMLWKQLEGDQEPWEGTNLLYRGALAKFTQSQQQGVLGDHFDPSHLMAILTGTHLFWLSNKSEYCRRNGLDPDDPAVDQHYLDNFVNLFLYGALPR